MLVALDLNKNEPGLLPQPASPASAHTLTLTLDGFMARLRGASSGHQFLVFVVTALVEGVRQGSIVLLDEIETYVHPYLLCNKLGLLALYNRISLSYVRDIPGELRRRDLSGPLENTASALAELATNLVALRGANYPRAVLYRAAASTREFLAYCRRLSA